MLAIGTVYHSPRSRVSEWGGEREREEWRAILGSHFSWYRKCFFSLFLRASLYVPCPRMCTLYALPTTHIHNLHDLRDCSRLSLRFIARASANHISRMKLIISSIHSLTQTPRNETRKVADNPLGTQFCPFIYDYIEISKPFDFNQAMGTWEWNSRKIYIYMKYKCATEVSQGGGSERDKHLEGQIVHINSSLPVNQYLVVVVLVADGRAVGK